MEIVKVQPQLIKKEMIKPVIEDKFELRTYLDKEAEENLKRVKDLLSQKFKRAVTTEEVMSYLMKDYLKREDPLQKAERFQNKQVKPQLYLSTVENMPGRKPIPAKVMHAVNLRDKSQCTYKDKNNHRCSNQRWLHIHHIKPVARGGENIIENLTTLCASHHKFLHEARI
jgi:5-methylcytosine-specific restriction endonuclease McrA